MLRPIPFVFSVAFLLVFAIPGGPLGAAGNSASENVSAFQASLIDVMKKADQTSVRQRYEHLAPTVESSFHIPLMVQIAAGNHWNQATREERIQLIRAFRRMSVSTLATLFSGYSGEVFQVLNEKEGPRHTQLVMTELIKSDKSTVDITYVSRRFEDGWRIIDVVVDSGISELKVRRSEYHLVLKKSGVPGLIDLLNAKADELMSE